MIHVVAGVEFDIYGLLISLLGKLDFYFVLVDGFEMHVTRYLPAVDDPPHSASLFDPIPRLLITHLLLTLSQSLQIRRNHILNLFTLLLTYRLSPQKIHYFPLYHYRVMRCPQLLLYLRKTRV